MPDDPLITEMDPVQRSWMFNSWIEDRKENIEFQKNHAYLIGGFANPAMLSKILDKDNNTIESSDEAFEKSLEIVKSSRKNTENKTSLKRRRHKKIQ